MEPNLQKVSPENTGPVETVDSLPFPFNQQSFCRFESIEKTIDCAHVLIVDNLLRDEQDQEQRRTNRVTEYQYRFVRIVEPEDPIFAGIDNPESRVWQDYTREGRILRVWQNHGLQLDRVPTGFKLLARSYLCRNQMMVKRSDNQLVYSVQFHLEKSFEDWHKSRTRWEHPNESRDGRLLFENFLRLALVCQNRER